jgi:hypothetical protein
LPITSIIIGIRHVIIGADVVIIGIGVLVIGRVATVIGVIGIGIGERSRPITPPRPPSSPHAMTGPTGESVSDAAAKSRMEAARTSMKTAT